MTDQHNDKAVARIDPAYAAAMPAPMGGALPTGLEWQALERMAETLAASDVIPYRLKRKTADVAVILLAAREYGIPPLMALAKLPVVNGQPAPMGELMVALILRAGHYIAADFRNPDGSIYAGGPITPQHYGEARYKRRDWDEREVLRFTIDEALRADLIDRIDDGVPIARVVKTKDGKRVEERQPWELYTPNMARWRAVANAARLNFADVLLGLSYLPEELGAYVDAEGAPVVTGEVVEAPTRQAPAGGTLEERTAQEAATRLEGLDLNGLTGDQVRTMLDNGLRHAVDNGYADASVKFRGNPMTLSGVVAILKAELADAEANTVDGVLVEDEDETPAGEAATAPPTAEQAPAGTGTPAEAGEAGSAEADRFPSPADVPADRQPGETGAEAMERHQLDQAAAALEDAYDVARHALTVADVEVLRTLYRGSAELLTIDVLAVLGDDDLATLGAPPDVSTVALGGLLMQAAAYVEKHRCAVRDPEPDRPPVAPPTDTTPPPADDTPPADPWAADDNG